MPGDPIDPTTPLGLIADLSEVMLLIQLPAYAAGQVKIGAEVVVEGESGRGRVVGIDRKVSPANQSIEAKAFFPNQSGRLTVDRFVQVRLVSQTDNTLLIPKEALVRLKGGDAVFVKTSKGYEERSVKIESESMGKVRIKGYLRPGEHVVVVGAASLKGVVAGLGGE
ncbi:MAG: hypothetical protein K6347_06055 [Campylobacterales bacterium]